MRMKEIERNTFFTIPGRNEGIEFWTVENSYLMQRFITEDTFFESDVTLVLQTRGHFYGTFTHNLHIWVGVAAAAERVAIAARFAALIDLMLRRRTTLHWERQGQECDLFMSYFPPALHYLPGKYSDYYYDKKDNTPKKQLFSVHSSGKYLRVKKVECAMSSLNKCDPLILMTEEEINVLGRGDWNIDALERVADAIRFRERRSEEVLCVLLNKYTPMEYWDNFYKLLGLSDLNTFPEIPGGTTDEETDSTTHYKLYEILRNRKGDIYYKNMKFPLERTVLDSHSLYILTNGQKDINLWIGKKNQDRNKVKLYAMAKIQEFMTHSKWPHSSWIHLAIIPEGLESLSFKDHFKNWNPY